MKTFQQLKYTLFGTKSPMFLNYQKTLVENFDSLCRLSFFKRRSFATHRLIEDLKNCELLLTRRNKSGGYNIHSSSEQERLHDIGVLELAKLAIQQWEQERAKLSTRTQLIVNFKQQINSLQSQLIAYDEVCVIQNTQLGRRSWLNPLFYGGLFKNYFTGKQLQRYETLAHSLQTTTEQPTSKKSSWMRFSYAIFMPIFNSLIDFDLFFESFDTCVNLVGI